jgi:methylenetetrahydrofolate--tRNA-(uracil-5-)-methyltransferase
MKLKIIGGGLAGSEAAWQAAERGIDVELFEMRPTKLTGAHITGKLGELVCSNSLGSDLSNRASGLIKAELRRMGSLLIECADACKVPAGRALAVDREMFSDCIQKRVKRHPRINLIRKEVKGIPDGPTILATGPLTSQTLSKAIQRFTGKNHLYFYDAIAPIIEMDSIDMTIAFRANRYEKDAKIDGDYINCPFDKERYDVFRKELIQAKRHPLKTFEKDLEAGVTAGNSPFFQGCQPIEIIASQGEKSLAFGPLRPVGLYDPATGRRPYAVVQLRQDNLAGELYNLVGFQTNLMFSEQERVFRMIPGLENAEFERLGQMHRNTFIASPLLLNDDFSFKSRPDLFVAGQLAGIEGYAGNIASGLITGINVARSLHHQPPYHFPQTTMIGALMHYITHAEVASFQPMKAVFGILPKPNDNVRRKKPERYAYYAHRALNDLEMYLQNEI